MKNIYATLLLLCYSFLAFTQPLPHNQFKNDLTRQKLHGKIKSLTENEYNAGGDSLKLKSVTIYNDSGNQISFFTYAPDGAVLSRTTFQYNDSGKIVEEKRLKSDGTLNVRTTYLYDVKGNKIEEDNYDASGIMFLKILNKFDGKGNRIVKDSYNEFGSLFLKCNTKFDELGNEITAKEFDSHHGLKFSTTYEYENVDKHGNWLKRSTLKNDEPAAVTDREIIYQ
jgi:hypothetical protein